MWQHCDCMCVNDNVENYQCEQCHPRPYSREIKMNPQPQKPDPGCVYYMTLVRDDSLQIRQGECVYLIRGGLVEGDRGRPATPIDYDNIPKDKLDLFRVEQLWINEK